MQNRLVRPCGHFIQTIRQFFIQDSDGKRMKNKLVLGTLTMNLLCTSSSIHVDYFPTDNIRNILPHPTL